MEKKRILLIGTGGTIASEMSPNGLTPELNTTQLLHFVPELEQLCRDDCIRCAAGQHQYPPEHWLAMGRRHPGAVRGIRRLCDLPWHGYHGLYRCGAEAT